MKKTKTTEERLFLDESRFDYRKKPNMNAKVFLAEVEGGMSFIERAKSNPDLPLYVTGIIQTGDKPNRNGRIYPFAYLKRECLRYMDNEVKSGTSYGECFAEGHKILTRDNSWVDFKDLKGDEFVATMNPETKEFEWQQIMRRVAYEYEGEMVRIQSNSLDTLVTPNHKFWVSTNTNKQNFREVYAKDLHTGHFIPRHSIWSGTSPDLINITNEFGTLNLPTKAFAEFMGWYIAEGWFYINQKNGVWTSNISQCKVECVEEITRVLTDLGLPFKITQNDKRKSIEYTFGIFNKTLALYLSQFGKSNEKYVPQEIKNLKTEDINLFVDCYFKGDGWGSKGGVSRMAATISKRLAEDLLELFQKTGTDGKITFREQYATFYTIENIETEETKEVLDLVWYTNKEYTDNKSNFQIVSKRLEYKGTFIYFISQKHKPFFSIANALKPIEQYKGMVYCVEVPNHIIYVMNDGKPFWSKNCDHPENSTTPSLSNASHTIEDIWFKDKDVYARILILNAFMPDRAPGRLVRGFLLNGKSVGISSRALGSLEEDANSEYDVVSEDLELITFDLVSNASNFGSEKMNLVTEGKVKGKSLLLTESQAFGTSSIRENKLKELTESEKTYLSILGVKKFLQIKSR